MAQEFNLTELLWGDVLQEQRKQRRQEAAQGLGDQAQERHRHSSRQVQQVARRATVERRAASGEGQLMTQETRARRVAFLEQMLEDIDWSFLIAYNGEAGAERIVQETRDELAALRAAEVQEAA